MRRHVTLLLAILMTIMLLIAPASDAGQVKLSDIEKLGELIFKDINLSLNGNQSCQTCHHPSVGFVDPENVKDPIMLPVSDGSDPTLFGGRNAPSAAYAGFSPILHFDDVAWAWVGGMFWDGRKTGSVLGDPLAEQALGPFLNPVEMAMPSEEAVVCNVLSSNYATLFRKVFPGTRRDTILEIYDNIGRAIAAFERSQAVTRFSSRFDRFYAACVASGIDVADIGNGTPVADVRPNILTESELNGLALFNDTEKGNCAACHPSGASPFDPKGRALFTDFTYDNLGIPTNWRVYDLADGEPPDFGLGDTVADENENGKFKVPTLRNVARTAPYGHNGYFATLAEIVNFYNTRDVKEWPVPEYPATMNLEELGNLGLTAEEEGLIVQFMMTLTDFD